VNKYVLSLLFLLFATAVLGQSKSKVNLISSSTTEGAVGPNGSRFFKVHNGVFKQDYSTLTSDSAYFYPDQNLVDAFSHVVINQGDTVHIYSDLLHYDGNTKLATLTNHVIMVDKDATLTTDNFTYNTATRIGIYMEGGKLVNKTNTLTSKNGYYFSFTRDAYFRYDVVCITPDAVIKTDTMRYNSGTRISYFYGPTIITGKDKDVLYTENGFYKTIPEQAFFGKRNLYIQKTKSLRGDSLFYDRLKGYGRAVNHVTFTDSEQRITLKGDMGEYFKANEQAVVTQNAYMIFVTEDSSAIKPSDKKLPADSLLKNNKKGAIESLTKKATSAGNGLLIDKKMTLKGITDSVTKKLPGVAQIITSNSKTIKSIADSLAKKLPNVPVTKAVKKPPVKNAATPAKFNSTTTPPPLKHTPVLVNNVPNTMPVVKRTPPPPPSVTPQIVYRFADTIRREEKPHPGIKRDSLFFAADTLKTQVMMFKDLKVLKQKQYDAAHRDTSIKEVKRTPSIVYKTAPKYIEPEPIPFAKDTSYLHTDYFGKPKPRVIKPAPKVVPKIVKAAPKLSPADSLKAQLKTDSIALRMPKPLSDTSHIRVIWGYNHSKLFKSDLQAKADSMFYSSSDSTIRMYVNPMIWTQASQLSGDTINLQMKNKKLDNLDMFPKAFIVNLDKKDSTFYNQAGGKRMHGIFKNSKLNSFVIIGNAETIYFKRDSVKNEVTDMVRTVSGKAYFDFDKGEISSNGFAGKYEGHGLPIGKVKDEDKILKGFIWKPKDRPISKAAILSGYYKKQLVKKPVVKTGTAIKKSGKPSPIKMDAAKLGKDTLTNNPSALKMGKDSIINKPVIGKDSLIKKPAIIKSGRDSLGKDTTRLKRSIILKQ
jgi:lipopolysaccharide export system protein LptA